jgi:hypothetical protein
MQIPTEVNVPMALYPGVMPELTGKREFISVYVKKNQVHARYKQINTRLDSVNSFRMFYCQMIQLADSTDEGFSVDDSYISVYIDTSVTYRYADYILEEIKQADVPHILLKTRNKKLLNVGFYVPLIPMPEKRMSYVTKTYGRRIAIRFDRYRCFEGTKSAVLFEGDPENIEHKPVHAPYLNEDIVKKYKKSLEYGVDSSFFVTTWKNGKVHLNNSSYEVGEISKVIERNPRAVFLFELKDNQTYTDMIKLLDHMLVGYYLLLDSYCQKKFKKPIREVTSYALREIEKIIPFRFYVLSRAEMMFINDVDE